MTGKFKISVMGIGAYGCKVIDVLSKKGLHGADLITLSKKELKTSNRKLEVDQITLTEDYGSKLKHLLKGSLLTFLCFEPQDKVAKAELPKIIEIHKSLKTFLACVTKSPDKTHKSYKGGAEDSSKEIAESFTTIVIDDFSVEIVARFLKNLVEGVALPNLVGLDLSEIIDLLSVKGVATLGVGYSKTEAIEEATEQALEMPFLKANKKAKGARVYAYFSGGVDMRLDDLDKAAAVIIKKLGSRIHLEWGARVEEGMKGNVTVMALLTGIQLKR